MATGVKKNTNVFIAILSHNKLFGVNNTLTTCKTAFVKHLRQLKIVKKPLWHIMSHKKIMPENGRSAEIKL